MLKFIYLFIRGVIVLFDEIIKHFGSQVELARTLGIARANVSIWRRQGVPSCHAITIERLTDGKFKAVDMSEHMKK